MSARIIWGRDLETGEFIAYTMIGDTIASSVRVCASAFAEMPNGRPSA